MAQVKVHPKICHPTIQWTSTIDLKKNWQPYGATTTSYQINIYENTNLDQKTNLDQRQNWFPMPFAKPSVDLTTPYMILCYTPLPNSSPPPLDHVFTTTTNTTCCYLRLLVVVFAYLWLLYPPSLWQTPSTTFGTTLPNHQSLACEWGFVADQVASLWVLNLSSF